jgi:hypothetical protein
MVENIFTDRGSLTMSMLLTTVSLNAVIVVKVLSHKQVT